MRFPDLDEATRAYMVEEFDHDVRAGCLYLSHRLNERGKALYPIIFRGMLECGSVDGLTDALESAAAIATYEESVRNGRTTTRRVPCNAAETLAVGEFTRFYMRALCRRVLADVTDSLRAEVCRLRSVSDPRPESEARIGMIVDAEGLLEYLRRSLDADASDAPDYSWLRRPNTGLGIRLGSTRPTAPAMPGRSVPPIRLVSSGDSDPGTFTIVADGPVRVTVSAKDGGGPTISVRAGSQDASVDSNELVLQLAS